MYFYKNFSPSEPFPVLRFLLYISTDEMRAEIKRVPKKSLINYAGIIRHSWLGKIHAAGRETQRNGKYMIRFRVENWILYLILYYLNGMRIIFIQMGFRERP